VISYADCVNQLYAQLPVFHRTGPKAYKASLDNIIALCSELGNPHLAYPTIHVAGTNGKGSVCNMLASVLHEAGYRVGLHTSPHLIDLRERMLVNGKMPPESFITSVYEELSTAIADMQPSFFELTVVFSFEWFKRQFVDIAVIETGLGGRLDSTNIIQPQISIITNVQMDHTDLLGESLELIAVEKAGIIKEGIPCVLGPGNDRVLQILQAQAKEKHATIQVAEIPEFLPECDLKGAYQKENLSTALCALDVLRDFGWEMSNDAVLNGLKNVRQNNGFRGRWETIQHEPKVIIDVCHNPDGMKASMATLGKEDFRDLILILGFSADKDVSGMLALLPACKLIIATKANSPRAMNTSQIARAVKAHSNTDMIEISSPKNALSNAIQTAHPNDLILVLGSIYLISEIIS
jgi:dihydrofolate synthase/folylpolyglutamate synthase